MKTRPEDKDYIKWFAYANWLEGEMKFNFPLSLKTDLDEQIKELEEGLMFAKADGHAKQTIIESQEKYIKELEEFKKEVIELQQNNYGNPNATHMELYDLLNKH